MWADESEAVSPVSVESKLLDKLSNAGGDTEAIHIASDSNNKGLQGAGFGGGIIFYPKIGTGLQTEHLMWPQDHRRLGLQRPPIDQIKGLLNLPFWEMPTSKLKLHLPGWNVAAIDDCNFNGESGGIQARIWPICSFVEIDETTVGTSVSDITAGHRFPLKECDDTNCDSGNGCNYAVVTIQTVDYSSYSAADAAYERTKTLAQAAFLIGSILFGCALFAGIIFLCQGNLLALLIAGVFGVPGFLLIDKYYALGHTLLTH